MKIQIREFMSTPVVTTTIDSNVAYVRELMERKDVSAVPIVEMAGEYMKLRGIVTLYDICGTIDENTPITEVMTENVQAVTPETSVVRAANIMTTSGIHHLIVMERGRIVGIISTMDFVKLVSEKKLRAFASVVFV